MANNYKDLKVWQRSHALAKQVYRTASKIRGSDNLSFRAQIKRAAFSVPANIVEGNGVQSPLEFSRFLRISINSLGELRYHLETAVELELLPVAAVTPLLTSIPEIENMLTGLMEYQLRKAKKTS